MSMQILGRDFLGAMGRVLATAAVASWLSGCNALDPVPDTTRYYTLSTPGKAGHFAAVATENAPLIGVRIGSVASHLRRSAIAVRASEHELRYRETQRWAEELDGAIEQAVVAGVQRRVGSQTAVVVAPPLRRPAPDVVIELDLLNCEGREGQAPVAVLVADWRIFDATKNAPVANGRFYVEKSGWTTSDYSQLASLLSAAVDDLAGAVAEPAAKIAAETKNRK